MKRHLYPPNTNVGTLNQISTTDSTGLLDRRADNPATSATTAALI